MNFKRLIKKEIMFMNTNAKSSCYSCDTSNVQCEQWDHI